MYVQILCVDMNGMSIMTFSDTKPTYDNYHAIDINTRF